MSTEEPRLGTILLKSTGLTLLFLLLFFILTIGILGFFGYRYLNKVTTVGGIDIDTLKQNVIAGWQSDKLAQTSELTFLVLGVDTVANKPDAPQLTDTMLLLTLDLESGRIAAVSLPRDLWSSEYQTKINALYHYGMERDPENPTAFPQQALQEMTGVEVDTVVLVSLSTVAEIIDAIGGITVDVEQGFTDEEFPRDDVDPSSSDPAILYETITFEPGVQEMNGERAIKFIRSRKSSSEEEGTDIARSKRQTKVIDALIDSATNKSTVRDPETVGRLLKIYNQKFASSLPLTDIVAISKKMYESNGLAFEFKTHSLSLYPDDPAGVITHPPLSREHQNQWVYVVRDAEAFQAELRQALGLEMGSETGS